MIYLSIKAAHLISLFVWIAGMTAVALALKYPWQPFIAQLQAYDRRVTTPAMILAWCFGLYLATRGGWTDESWFGAKVALVIILSGLHGVLTGRLRLASVMEGSPIKHLAGFLTSGLALIATIVFLVVLKP